MSSEPIRLSVDAIIGQIAEGLQLFSAFDSYEVVDVTESTIKIRIYVQKDLYVQLYSNISKVKLNLTLVHGNKRIYGEDSAGIWNSGDTEFGILGTPYIILEDRRETFNGKYHSLSSKCPKTEHGPATSAIFFAFYADI